MDVGGQGVSARVVAVVGGVGGFDAGDGACLQAVAAVDDPAVTVEDDGVQEAVRPDVVGEGVEIVLVEVGEEQNGRMELNGILRFAGGG